MKTFRLMLVPFALLVIAFVRLVRPLILIRFGEICSFRLGHLAANTELYLCQKDASGLRSIDLFAHTGRIANRQLAKMFGRVMWIDPTRFASLVMTVDRRFRGWERHHAEPLQYDRDITNQMEKTPTHLKFTRSEIKRGERERRAMGIPDDAKWVCLIARDKRYLTSIGWDTSYHDYRDTDIKNYRQAALMLAERGYYVLRMGQVVNEEFGLEHPRVIDYATSGMRSDFMDIYLGAHCAFCVSNGTGFDAVPAIFRRPVCYVNIAPIEYAPTWMDSLFIWKHHYKDGKRLTMPEIIRAYGGQALSTERYAALGITLEENSPQEICDLAEEMANKVEGIWRGGIVEQIRFWQKFPHSISPYNGRPLQGKIRMRVGAKFLRQYETKLAVAA